MQMTGLSNLFSVPEFEKQIGSSLWLVVYSVMKLSGKGGSLEEIELYLEKALKKIHVFEDEFYLTWAPGYELMDILVRFAELGILEEITQLKTNKVLWKITGKGTALLEAGEHFAPKGIPLH